MGKIFQSVPLDLSKTSNLNNQPLDLSIKKRTQKKTNHKICGLKSSQLSPLNFKLSNICDTKSSTKHEKCYTKGCLNKRVYCARPCGHYGLCESCIQRINTAECGKCGEPTDEWTQIRDVGTLEDPNECAICYSKAKRVACLPCNHFLACTDCICTLYDKSVKELKRLECPYCRTKLTSVIYIDCVRK